MAKKEGGGKHLPLPFTTFGELAALGLKATVYCPRFYEHRSIEPVAGHLRDRCFATTRFRCTKIRHTGDICGCPGSVARGLQLRKPHAVQLKCPLARPAWMVAGYFGLHGSREPSGIALILECEMHLWTTGIPRQRRCISRRPALRDLALSGRPSACQRSRHVAA